MAAFLCVFTFLLVCFGNILSDINKNIGSLQQNITHIVSKETSKLDKALSETEHEQNTSLPSGTDQPQSSGFTAARTEAPETFITAATKTLGASGDITARSNPERLLSPQPLPLSGSLPQSLNQGNQSPVMVAVSP